MSVANSRAARRRLKKRYGSPGGAAKTKPKPKKGEKKTGT